MPRRSRIMTAEAPVHIIQRGNNRGACFFADADYALYLARLRELSAALECAVHAHCLMTNHGHLLLTPQRAEGCALLMKHLGQRYVQHVNRTYRRSGAWPELRRKDRGWATYVQIHFTAVRLRCSLFVKDGNREPSI